MTNALVYEYRLEGRNSCGYPLESDAHHSIVLKGEANEKEETIHLQWNDYQHWSSGVKYFEIWRQLDISQAFELYDRVPANTFEYVRQNAKEGFMHCYKVRAVEQKGNHTFSWSNATCLEFQHELAFYNVITPNGDQDNDTWQITNLEIYPQNDLKIYNRWGMEVYHKQNYRNEWDGEGVSVGVYYFTLAVQGNHFSMNPQQKPAPYNRLFRGIINVLR